MLIVQGGRMEDYLYHIQYRKGEEEVKNIISLVWFSITGCSLFSERVLLKKNAVFMEYK